MTLVHILIIATVAVIIGIAIAAAIRFHEINRMNAAIEAERLRLKGVGHENR